MSSYFLDTTLEAASRRAELRGTQPTTGGPARQWSGRLRLGQRRLDLANAGLGGLSTIAASIVLQRTRVRKMGSVLAILFATALTAWMDAESVTLLGATAGLSVALPKPVLPL